MLKKIIIVSLIFVMAGAMPASAAKPIGGGKPGGGGASPSLPHVCIDPGHGGADPGAVRGSIRESDLNLSVAHKVSAKLAETPIAASMTRVTDEGLSNGDRYNFCNSTAANSLVSIHHNASTDASIDYTVGLYQQSKSVRLAETVTASIANALGNRNNGLTRFSSGVLIKSDMPSMISEGYFISNADRLAELNDPIAREALENKEAQAIVDGLIWYYGL